MNDIQLHCGDIIEILADKPDESYVACFCDPPYGLSKQPNMTEVLTHWLNDDSYEHNSKGFMGKTWDSFVPGPKYWREIYRVLKPGAILLAFCGTRTEDLLGISIRLAGFERFDTCAWLHGQGFPKSRAIGAAIDKEANAERKVIGIKPGHEDFAGRGNLSSVQSFKGTLGGKGGFDRPWMDDPEKVEKYHMATAPATNAASIWEGYGTSLKPAIEFILCFRKPRRDTYAQTAIEHCSGALNIAGCRVGAEKITINTWDDGMKPFGDGAGHPFTGRQQSGRWPANLLLSHLPECKRVGVKKVKTVGRITSDKTPYGSERTWQVSKTPDDGENRWYADPDGLETVAAYRCAEGCPVAALGLPARFFQTFEGERFHYCAKSSRGEREAGLQGHLPCLTCGEASTTHHINKTGRKIACRRCDHPTVKPIALCEYIARLIRPPQAYLDEAQLLVPFCGVGSEIIGSLKAGWRNITGIDIMQEYIDIAELRIEEAQC